MAKYQVKAEDGVIKVGPVTEEGKWIETSDNTEEVLSAVREHFLYLINKEQKDISYGWHYDNGKTLLLKLEQKDTAEIKEGE